MCQQLYGHFSQLMLSGKKILVKGRRELITASLISLFVLVVRSLGLFQSLELAALDQLFRLRPTEPLKDRITIVAIDEESLRQIRSWPISDQVVAELLKQINSHQPRAIGLDIYRDMPVYPGHAELEKIYQSTPNLVGIQLLANNQNTRVLPPPILQTFGQVGFNNVLLDPDGTVRRSLLYWHINHQAYESFALKLALIYLKSEGIKPQKAVDNPQDLQLGKAVFTRLKSNDGGYVGADNRGYQILANFPKLDCAGESASNCHYPTVSLVDVLDGKVADNLIRDRIVLIGSTAPSLQDFFFIPYSSRLSGTAKPITGVELQAHFINEFISAALVGRPIFQVWPKVLESLWIVTWAVVGALSIGNIRQPKNSIITLLFSALILIGSPYWAFLWGWWIPIVPAFLAFTSSAMVITYRIAYMQEELKRSKEFLHHVINTIPDPIFVKNEQHQLIVLNDAYVSLIGYNHELLIEKSDYDFFPQHQADVFRQQDKLVFTTRKPHEHEEEFTDANGNTYMIATKRSLHRDAAGNFFLVGIIRDITRRKQKEEELKRTAAELSRSNYQLKLQEDHLRQLAYYDPLTGLCNRKCFLEKLSESLLSAENHRLMLGLLFIDLDGFKQVNDTLGHDMGDLLLITIAQRLKNSLRASDIVSRLGGDEFTIIIPTLSNLQIAGQIAEKVLGIITEPILLNDTTVKVSASIGISVYPLHSQDIDNLIKQADMAMYMAKKSGKNAYQLALSNLE
ncbi:diguanylate cyclase with PAS/PAC and Chase2 sensors [Richelia sinica FACHB-800]|uniref:Diguanylate cyclase with PAS/PAC and Chase2 sensors n=1 Tax=Richelia sinica FACHB-800 TaxID=1357546 RepID=A0A975TDH8_9NOST|nr:CHASE2 domain-containing protein [Richelia sinica]MBD2666775.1 CHASE2 domain-containing protein [Richelia sinica FACHB-800]QXE26078.1 diguanylate cyclase with PAS/PAC and Chase2 sensors [Richelia sinica FACHB-800]